MPTQIDNLDIKISSDVSNAVNSIDRLETRLSSLSRSLSSLNGTSLVSFSSGLRNLSDAVNQISTIDSRVFKRIVDNFNRLGSVNTSGITTAASAMQTLSSSFAGMTGVGKASAEISQLVKALSKLSNASFRNAISELPRLTTALTNFLHSMSTAPRVRRDTIDMANAMAYLASQGVKVGSASRAMVSASNGITRSFSKQQNMAKSLSSAIGKLYQTYFWVTKIAKAAFNAIKASMDYIEVQNYFDSALEQVIGNADISKWKELGFDSAKEYANSFSETLKSLSKQMTGYEVSSSGMLVQADTEKALGLNPTELLNYETQFAQMASSIGLTSDNAVKLSKVLTELGGDLASVKNMDFAQVWNNEASGILAGMSRAVDKYGVNIRNSALQQELTNLGIDATVTNLSQQDKVLLRTIVTLKSSKYAWADLADTINQPANQMRLLQANVSNLSRSIGNIFLPVVAKVIPIVNELVYALATLAEYITTLLGFKGFDWGGSSAGISDLNSDIADADDALESASGSASKFKKQLQGFDELNNLTSTNGGGGGKLTNADLLALQEAFDAAIRKYQERWDKGFEDMSASAHRFAQEVANAFKNGGLFGVGRYFSESLAKALESIDWRKIKEGAKKCGEKLASFLNGFITPDLFGEVGKTIASIISTKISLAFGFVSTFDFKNLGKSVASGINNFFANYDMGTLATTLSLFATGVLTAISTALADVNWDLVGTRVGEFLANIDWAGVILGTLSVVFGAIDGVFKTFDASFALSPVSTSIIAMVIGGIGISKVAIPAISSVVTLYSKLVPIFKTLVASVSKFVTYFKFTYSLSGSVFSSLKVGIMTITKSISPLVKGFGGVLTVFTEFIQIKNSLYDIAKGSDHLGRSIGTVITTLTTSGLALTALFGFPAGTIAAGVVALISGIAGINKAFNDIETEKFNKSMYDAIAKPGGYTIDELSETFRSKLSSVTDSIGDLEGDLTDMENANKSIESVWKEIDQIKFSMDNGVLSVEEGTARLSTLFGELQSIAEDKFNALNGALASSFGTDGAIRTGLEQVGVNVEGVYASALGISEDAMARIVEISEKLSTMEYGDEGYAELSLEYAKLTGHISDTDKAITDFTETMANLDNIDWSQFFDENGLDSGKVTAFLEGISTSVSTAQESVKNGYDELEATLREELALCEEGSAEYEQIKSAIESIPKATEYWSTEFSTQAKAITDALQRDLIDTSTGIIEEAQKDWADLNPLEKIKFKSEGDFINQRLAEWQSNVDSISSGIETSMEELGIEGAGWASECASNIINAMFTDETMGVVGSVAIKSKKLNDNWKEIIDGASDGISSYMESAGGDSVEGFLTGLEHGGQGGTFGDGATKSANKFLEFFCDAMGIHSPSKEMYDNGVYSIEGLNNGLTDSTNTLLIPNISVICDNMIESFRTGLDPLSNVFTEVFTNACNAAIDVFNLMLEGINKSLTYDIDFTNPITNQNTKAQGTLGKFTPIPKFAQGGFPEDGLFYANHNELVGGFGNRTAVANNDQIIDGIEAAVYRAFSDVMSSNSQQTNVEVTLQGDADGIFRVVRESAQKYRKSTGNSAF